MCANFVLRLVQDVHISLQLFFSEFVHPFDFFLLVFLVQVFRFKIDSCFWLDVMGFFEIVVGDNHEDVFFELYGSLLSKQRRFNHK